MSERMMAPAEPRHAEAGRPRGFKSTIQRWLGIEVTPKDGDFWRAWYGTNDGGVVVTPDLALQISTVWACVRLISQTIATLPLFLYRRDANDRRDVARDLDLFTMLHSAPNPDSTAVVFWEAIVSALLLRGVAVVEKRRYAGRVVALKFLAPDRVSRQKIEGVKRWRYREDDGTWRTLDPRDLMVIPGFTADGEDGLSVIQYAANVFGNAIAANRSSSKMLSNGMRATGFVSTDMILSKENRDKFRDNLREFNATGSEIGGTMLLEGGMKYTPSSLKPEDMQLLQTRTFNVSEICRWFGVPPHMVGHTEGATSWGSGLEQQTIGFVKFCLIPWIRRIEQAINQSLIEVDDRAKLYAEFELGGLMRGDSAARANLYSSGSQNGWMTRREIRGYENLPAHEGDDVLTVQSNLVPLDQLGAAPPAAPPPAAPPPGADPDPDNPPPPDPAADPDASED